MGPENVCTGECISNEFKHLMAEWPAAEQSIVTENLAKEMLLGVRPYR